jgi:hypothetical protein
VGFVDRVMTQVRPVPWYRRLGRALFFPLLIKLPLEAGAMAMVAVLGVYLLQTTPELKDAARHDALSASSPPPIERSAPSAPSPEAPPPERDREKETKRQALMLPRPPASSEDDARRGARDEAQKNVRSPAPPPAQEPSGTEVPAARSRLSRSTEARESVPEQADADKKGSPSAAPAAPPVLSAKQQMAAPVVTGVLTVTDRQRAEQSLAELIRKTGAREIARREESDAVVVEMAVPQPEYAAFTRELAALGSLRIEGQPAEIPPVVRLSVRISQ